MLKAILDKEFLTKLDSWHNKEIWAKIVALDLEERPLEEITGKITSGGSINIDGASCIRRTCSFTMSTEDVNINDFYWGLNTKFKLFIGLSNDIDKNYPDIIWFPQGVYFISSFSTSLSTTNYNISIQGKDKMCMLNGELGGTITALTQDFGIADYVDAQGKTIKKENILIKDIITSGVHTFANEPFSNIVVNDLDDALALMEYRGEEPMYAILNEDTQLIEQISFDPLDLPKWENAKETIRFDNNSFNFNSFKDFYQGFSENYTLVSYNGKKCSVIKIDHGETAGYTITGLTYPGELVGKIGESFTTILDKIVKAFGDFEYFYDTDGTFIFQKKKIYVNQTWSPLVESEDGVYVQTMEDTPYGYEFQGNKLITSFSNTPNFSKVKNDFAIWGVNNSGGPIHLRYAIHKKPERYMTFPRPVGDLVDKQVLFISDNINGYHTTIDENGQIIKYCDWREIIFQMAYDYNFHHLEDDFLVNIEKNNIYKDKEETINLYPKGKTGYEQYYIDLIGFWREIYNPLENKTELKVLKTSNVDMNNKVKPTAPEGEEILVKGYYKPCPEKIEFGFPNYNSLNTYKVYKTQGKEEYIVVPFTADFICGYFPWEAGKEQNLFKNLRVYKNESDKKVVQTFKAEDNTNEYRQELAALVQKDWRNLYVVRRKMSYDKNSNQIILGEVEITLNNEHIYDSWSDFYFRFSYYYDTYIRDKNIPNTDGRILLGTCSKEEKNKLLTDIIKENSFTKPIYYDENNKQYHYSYIYDNNLRENQEIEYVYEYSIFYQTGEKTGWNKDILLNPENLIFWFDFLDAPGAEIEKYSVATIGDRVKTLNETSVKSIYYRETPAIIFVDNMAAHIEKKTGYIYVQIPKPLLDSSMFIISGQGKSAMDVLNECLYNDAICAESASITMIPIYYLEPNAQIYIRDDNSKINGKYAVSRYTIPLGHSGTMSATATKIIDRLY